jgi:uncharacterized protein (DUF1684 family)
VTDELELLDWKRRVFQLYADVRAASEPERAWERWRAGRDELFLTHPQSPLDPAARAGFDGLPYFPYDPALRLLADVEPAEAETREIAGSADSVTRFRRFARTRFDTGSLELYWLEGYGGGVFLPFADGTRGRETYGGGRYLLDTVKGADLGTEDGRLVLDFNFAYNPSCAYDPRWACPLTPAANRLGLDVRAGERMQGGARPC